MYFHPKRTLDLRRALRKRSTFCERLLWARLRLLNSPYKFKRQIGIGRYIVDFYTQESRVIIEIDGGYHLSLSMKALDKDRDQFLEALGYRVLRFTNEQVELNVYQVMKKILDTCTERLRK